MTLDSWRIRWSVLIFMLGCDGCSFVNERFPPSTPAAPAESLASEPRRRTKPCPRDGFWSPVLDTVSVAAGLTWVLYANKRAESRPYVPAHYDNNRYYPEQPGEAGDNGELTKAARYWGYGSMLVFGASAIYGYLVEGSCLSYRNRIEHDSTAVPSNEPARAVFPGAVLQFKFSMALAEAGNACENSGRVFQVDGNAARCVNAPGSLDTSEMRLRYSLGTPSEITVIYHVPSKGLSAQYRRLSDSLGGFYGEPQIAAPSLPAACAATLEQCLAAGEHPRGPVWHWPNGSIEVVPMWRDEQALIEIRYTREE